MVGDGTMVDAQRSAASEAAKRGTVNMTDVGRVATEKKWISADGHSLW